MEVSPLAEAPKTRVYELAKELNLDSRRLIDLLRRLGVIVRNHMSTLEPETIEKVRDVVRGGPNMAGPPPPPKPPAPRPPVPPRAAPHRPKPLARPVPPARTVPQRPTSERGHAGPVRPSVRAETYASRGGTTVSSAHREGPSPAETHPVAVAPTPPAPAVTPAPPTVPQPQAPVAVTPAPTVRPAINDDRAASGALTISAVHQPEPSAAPVEPQAAPETESVAAIQAAPSRPVEVQGRTSVPARPAAPVRPNPSTRPAHGGVSHPYSPRPRVEGQTAAPNPRPSAPRMGVSRPYSGPAAPGRTSSQGARAPYRPGGATTGRPPMRSGASAPARSTGPSSRPGTSGRPPAPGRGGSSGRGPAPARSGGRTAAAPAGRPAGRGGPRGGARGPRRDEPWSRDRGGHGRRENLRGGMRPQKRRGAVPVRNTDRPIVIEGAVSVQTLAQRMGVTGAELIRTLIGMGAMVTLTQEIDADTAALAVQEMGFTADVRDPRPTLEQELEGEEADQPEDLKVRAPVVTVMGHVDHGKTSLLDAIRKTNVTAHEAGGITQHIGAYTVRVNDREIVFLDTPGHEAFTAMRARGAQVTDVVVLVVAADDGPMPQTLEALSHARSAGVPVVVAINKTDVPGANPDRVKQALADQGLLADDWGGDTLMVPVSALRRTGLENLLESILLVADLRELHANPAKHARGTVIEGRLDRGRGPVATVLVQDGTLQVGDVFVVGATTGRVRALFDDQGEPVKEAGPSMPVEVLGFEDVPKAGDRFVAVDDERKARDLADQRRDQRRTQTGGAGREGLGFEELFRTHQAAGVLALNLVIKADVQGSLEAVTGAIEALSTEEVPIHIVHRGVGAISESDVMLAQASDAELIGFNVRPDAKALSSAETAHLPVATHRVIYELLDDLRARVAGLRKPEFKEQTLGRAEVRQVFRLPKGGVVAGLYVTDGKVTRAAKVRLLRDGAVVHDGKVASLRRFKDDVREVASGFECGMGIERFSDIKDGDVVEAYILEEVKGA